MVEVTAQSQSREASQISVAIDEKLCLGKIAFLGDPMEECGGGIGAAVAEKLNVQEEFCVNIDGGVDPVPRSTNLDSSFIDSHAP